jgi:hypothetical protein
MGGEGREAAADREEASSYAAESAGFGKGSALLVGSGFLEPGEELAFSKQDREQSFAKE